MVTVIKCYQCISIIYEFYSKSIVRRLRMGNLYCKEDSSTMSVLSRNEIEQLKQRLQKAEEQVVVLQKEIQCIKEVLCKCSTTTSSLTALQKRKFSTLNSETDGSESNYNFTVKKQNIDATKGYMTVYTDGACENNGKVNAKAGIGVWFGSGHSWNISEPVKGRPTNNTAEIQACIRAIEKAHSNGIKKLLIKTDSQFVINSMTKWIKRWKQNNWKLSTGGDVKNKTDFVKLDTLINLLDDVQWEYVAGHAGNEGNEEADRLARNGATLYKPT
ncbi:ribonuclease H1 isoform X2 [Agrilus planipennis]|uniref:Ribonuclease H1 isoform X2 n=1 Tax=Agrilus planipennis TaxID=224129 RepID=A0A1W4WK64_AGRPL|nr:ribonuclease H1 isoform X2 [Agrilus planipennis]